MESPGGVRVRLGVELCKPDFGFQIGRNTIEMRCHHFAWSAPLSPKIHYQRNAAAIHMGREIGVSQDDWFARIEDPLAATTRGLVIDPRAGKPVNCAAMRAGHMMLVIHRLTFAENLLKHGVGSAHFKGLLCDSVGSRRSVMRVGLDESLPSVASLRQLSGERSDE